MLRIMAIAPEDGWAFVERDGKFLLLKPPYSQRTIYPASERSVSAAINKYGFEALSKEFQDWGSLLEFLRATLSQKEPANRPDSRNSRLKFSGVRQRSSSLSCWHASSES